VENGWIGGIWSRLRISRRTASRDGSQGRKGALDCDSVGRTLGMALFRCGLSKTEGVNSHKNRAAYLDKLLLPDKSSLYVVFLHAWRGCQTRKWSSQEAALGTAPYPIHELRK